MINKNTVNQNMKGKKLVYETEESNKNYKIIERNFETIDAETVAEIEIAGSSVNFQTEDYEAYYEAYPDDDISDELDIQFMRLLEAIYDNKRYYKTVDASDLKDLQEKIKLIVEGYIGSEIDFSENEDQINMGGIL